MTLSSMLSALTVSSALLCVTALAQARYCIGGDLEHLSQAQKSACSAKMQVVRSIGAALHAPENWHFVVVCGEEGWKQYADYSVRDGGSVLNASIDTNLEEHETFVREDHFDAAHLGSLQSSLAREIAVIVAHNDQQLALSNARAEATASSQMHPGS